MTDGPGLANGASGVSEPGRPSVLEARTVVEALGMRAHPEGGWYVETWRADASPGERPVGSAILYLLETGQRSHWHRVDAHEIWQHSGGDALELRVWADGDLAVTTHRLGSDVAGSERVQAVVPAGAWQAARPLGAWSLVGCIVTPAFDFAGFELARPDWEPPAGEACRGRLDSGDVTLAAATTSVDA